MDEKQKGGISVNTENIFPVIKKWLYSEKDIFLREIVSNATDAITKHKRLCALGEATADDAPYRIDVTLDRVAKTLTVEDNGIGMSEEELKKYICSIALSGAVDFLQKYESSTDNAKGGIIGHFGLGFYSAFMVSDTVEIHTRSHTGAPAVHWVCNAEGEYELEQSDREGRGTEVILHIAEEENAYLNPVKIREMLQKYCAFMPVEIYFDDGDEKKEEETPAPINDTTPLWQKPISDCTEEEYKEFYHKVFPDMRDPLFQIHLNADYPLNFKGILYFPRLNPHFESTEGEVKLYYNQVFVADNVSEVIPEYLLMLRGVLDCPELPLNVSRSYLQTNSYVSKLSAHIVKKVADKLVQLCNNERAEYEKVWNDIKTFVEFAALHDEKFFDRVKGALLLKRTDGKYQSINEYLEGSADKCVYYTTDKALQAQYIAMYEAENIPVAELDTMLDTQFVAFLEAKLEGVKFRRVDADLSALGNEEKAEENKELCELFQKASGNETLSVKVENLKNADVPAILNIPEDFRRMQDTMRMYRMMEGEQVEDALPHGTALILNAASPLMQKLTALSGADAERALALASYIYKLSLLSVQKLSAAQMQQFLAESYRLLTDLAQ
ncbi:MAG: molecular chaperone HtpG [Ruminococcaceae bacterium]|nr:molecular chaperone HtpG [Oscillospiraceae bacterium]